MDQIQILNVEENALERTSEINVPDEMIRLNELQLLMVGGGIGDAQV